MSHPAVLEVAVIGVPDEKLSERPTAFVVLKVDALITENELIDHVRAKIARYKAPRNVDFLIELPKTSTGKIRAFALRDPEWAGKTHRVQD
jgi:fatty-acyl-CoA synthase